MLVEHCPWVGAARWRACAEKGRVESFPAGHELRGGRECPHDRLRLRCGVRGNRHRPLVNASADAARAGRAKSSRRPIQIASTCTRCAAFSRMDQVSPDRRCELRRVEPPPFRQAGRAPRSLSRTFGNMRAAGREKRRSFTASAATWRALPAGRRGRSIVRDAGRPPQYPGPPHQLDVDAACSMWPSMMDQCCRCAWGHGVVDRPSVSHGLPSCRRWSSRGRPWCLTGASPLEVGRDLVQADDQITLRGPKQIRHAIPIRPG